MDHHLDVIAIQETHLARAEITCFRHTQFPLIYCSSASTKHRWVALLFQASTKFQPLDIQHDREGRWLMAKGHLLGRLCSFVVMYAPNVGQAPFLETLLNCILDFVEAPLFLLGDFNLVWQKDLDSSHTHHSDWSVFSPTTRSTLQTMGLLDAWRTLYPSTKYYTFYSHVHQSYSRLDYIFLSQTLQGDLQEAKIFPLSISDHSLCAISLTWDTDRPNMRRWFFPPAIVRDKTLCLKLRDHIQEFFKVNDPEATSAYNNWDTFKAVLRGHCISLNTALNTQRNKERVALEGELHAAELTHKSNPTRTSLRQLTALRGKLRAIYSNRSELRLLKLRQLSYSQGNKVGKHLARQLRGQTS